MTKQHEEKKGEVVPTKGGAIATYDYGEDVGAGFENQSKDDLALPFIDILQPTSPEVVKSQAAQSDGIRAGMIVNRVTGEVFDGKKGIAIIPAITGFTQVWKAGPHSPANVP